MEDTSNLTHPYCGGCGHRYFNEPQISISEAQEKARTRRCHYCYEDEKEDEKRRRTSYGASSDGDWSNE